MNCYNFSGRLTKDVESGKTDNNCSYAKFSVAVNMAKGKTIYINGVAYDKTADYLVKYGKKGMVIIISGRVDGMNKDNINVTATTADLVYNK